MTPSQRSAPAVSVVIPTYQRCAEVCRAVQSVFSQRFDDWEVIVVDDGSTDATDKALTAFRPRLRYRWEEHAGSGSARNLALSLARASIVAFLDSDDYWLPHHLHTVLELFARNPECVLVSTTRDFRCDGDEPIEAAVVVDPLPRLFVGSFVGWPSGVAVRREAAIAAGGFDEDLAVSVDYDLFVKLALRGTFALLRSRTIMYCPADNSLVRWGRPRGEFLIERIRSGERLLEGLLREDASSEVIRQARGNLRFAEALQALHWGRDSVAGLLAEACAELPELSTESRLVVERLHAHVPGMGDPARAREAVERLLHAWPDPCAPTAQTLAKLLV